MNEVAVNAIKVCLERRCSMKDKGKTGTKGKGKGDHSASSVLVSSAQSVRSSSVLIEEIRDGGDQ